MDVAARPHGRGRKTRFALVGTLITVGCSLQNPAPIFAELPPWVVKYGLETNTSTVLTTPRRPPPYVLAETQTVAFTSCRPRALTTPAQLESMNPGLLRALPRLAVLLTNAVISTNFVVLYDNKISEVRNGHPLPAHMFFDCATILHLTDPVTRTNVVLVQADMDVVTDGTDPERLPNLKDYDEARVSSTFQPRLAYGWPGSPTNAGTNPFLPSYSNAVQRVDELQRHFARVAEPDPLGIWNSISDEFLAKLGQFRTKYSRITTDLRDRRWLISALDPFIVLPPALIDTSRRTPHTLSVGDFAAVVHRGRVYPCLVGDTGPPEKIGEASLVLAKEISPTASGKMAAMHTPGITYLVFPGTAQPARERRPRFDERGRLDVGKEVKNLLDAIGGVAEVGTVHAW